MGKWRDRWELNEGGIVRFIKAVSPQNMLFSFNTFYQRLCFEHFFLSLLLKDKKSQKERRKVKNRDVNQDKQKDHNESIPYIL